MELQYTAILDYTTIIWQIDELSFWKTYVQFVQLWVHFSAVLLDIVHNHNVTIGQQGDFSASHFTIDTANTTHFNIAFIEWLAQRLMS